MFFTLLRINFNFSIMFILLSVNALNFDLSKIWSFDKELKTAKSFVFAWTVQLDKGQYFSQKHQAPSPLFIAQIQMISSSFQLIVKPFTKLSPFSWPLKKQFLKICGTKRKCRFPTFFFFPLFFFFFFRWPSYKGLSKGHINCLS